MFVKAAGGDRTERKAFAKRFQMRCYARPIVERRLQVGGEKRSVGKAGQILGDKNELAVAGSVVAGRRASFGIVLLWPVALGRSVEPLLQVFPAIRVIVLQRFEFRGKACQMLREIASRT